jgi:hypothetical protein
MNFERESEELRRSYWPKCDELASYLAQQGPAATDALKAAASSRIHHVRSAALKALNLVNPPEGKRLAEELLRDRAFEVRDTAAAILGVPTVDKIRRTNGPEV